jgi:hypothetical protein
MVLRLPSSQTFHQQAKRPSTFRRQQQVNMVSHEAEGINANPENILELFKRF